MTGKTKYFSDELVKITNSQKNSKYCQGIQTPVSARSQNYTGRDRYSFRERTNRAYSPQSSKVCIKFLPGEEEIRRIQTCDKSQEFKSVHSHRTLYNGDYYKSKNNVIKGRLDCDNKYFKCVSHYSSGRGI